MADAWLYGVAVPSTGAEGGPAASAPIQLSPTIAVRYVIHGLRQSWQVRVPADRRPAVQVRPALRGSVLCREADSEILMVLSPPTF